MFSKYFAWILCVCVIGIGGEEEAEVSGCLREEEAAGKAPREGREGS